MSEEATEQAATTVAAPVVEAPAETHVEESGVSDALAHIAGDKYDHILKDIAEENASEVVEQPTEVEQVQEQVEAINEEGESQEEPEAAQDDLHTINVNGQDQSLTLEELKSLANKGMRFTQKSQENAASIKKGLQLTQAESGDKEAIRAVIEGMLKGAGQENIDDLIDSLAGVEGKIDIEALESKNQFDADTRDAFQDINGGADSAEVQRSVTIIRAEVKNSWPSELYEELIANPYSVRQVHDSIQDGSFHKTMNQLQVDFSAMTPTEERQIKSNRELYIAMYDKAFDRVTHVGNSDQQATSADPNAVQEQSTNSLASLADEPPLSLSGNRREVTAAVGDDVDFMSDDDAYHALLKKINNKSRGL